MKNRAVTRITPLFPFGIQMDLSPQTKPAQLEREALLEQVTKHKLVLVRGLKRLERQELLDFISDDPQRDLVQWSFGPVMEMRVDPNAENYLFSREAVPFHWDGAFHIEPRALVFHCIEAPNPEMGGETIFCDTERLWQSADKDTKQAWRKVFLSYETEKKAHYGGKITASLVQKHPRTGRVIIRYAEPVFSQLNPVKLSVSGQTGSAEKFMQDMQERIYASAVCYAHSWQDNDLLLVDNFSLIHGRRAFADASPRHLRRLQLR